MEKKQINKICEYCGTIFIADYDSSSEFCDYKCLRADELQKRREARLANAKEKECVICGNVFKAIHSRQIYCSPECAQKKQKEKKNNSLVEQSRFYVFARDNFRCIYCGATPIENDKVRLHVEHIIPRYHGGDNSFYNVITGCNNCNFEKSCFDLSLNQVLELWERNIRIGFDPVLLTSNNMVRGFDEVYIVEKIREMSQYFNWGTTEEEKKSIVDRLVKINPKIIKNVIIDNKE